MKKYLLFLIIWFLIFLAIKILNPKITELFIRGRKISICLVFTSQSYFAVSKNIRLTSTHYFIVKIPNEEELQQIVFNNSSDIDFKYFINLYKKFTAKPFSFSVIDVTLASDSSPQIRIKLLERI